MRIGSRGRVPAGREEPARREEPVRGESAAGPDGGRPTASRTGLRRVLVGALLALGALSALNAGSAATLTVAPGTIAATSAGHPCPAGADVAPGDPGSGVQSSVRVSAGSGCKGRELTAAVLEGQTVMAEASAVLSGTGATIPTTSFIARSGQHVEAVVDGWSLDATWAYDGPVVGCTVVDTAGTPVAGRPCEVGVVVDVEWWDGWPARAANLYLSFSPTGLAVDQKIAFTVDLSQARGLPTDWAWTTSGVISPADYALAGGFRCTELPYLHGTTRAGWGSYPRTWVHLVEAREGSWGVACG